MICTCWDFLWIQLRTQEVLPESSLLIAVSWRSMVLLELQPINVQLRGSAAANACFRLLKYQPQRHHLWALCWNSPDRSPPSLLFALHTSLSCPTPLLPLPPSSLESASIPPSSRQYVHSITCTLSLTELPSPLLLIFWHSQPPPTTHTIVFEWHSRKGLKCASGGFSDMCPTDGAGWRCF